MAKPLTARHQLRLRRDPRHDHERAEDRAQDSPASASPSWAPAARAHRGGGAGAQGATVVVYNRTKERADELAAEFDGKSGKVVSARIEKLCDSCCEIFINTTSLGMHPNVDASAFGDRIPELTPHTLVFDTVYNPWRPSSSSRPRPRGR
jgi:hypothetical protein